MHLLSSFSSWTNPSPWIQISSSIIDHQIYVCRRNLSPELLMSNLPPTSPCGHPITHLSQILILTPTPPTCSSLILPSQLMAAPTFQVLNSDTSIILRFPLFPTPHNQSFRKLHWLCLHNLSRKCPLLLHLLYPLVQLHHCQLGPGQLPPPLPPHSLSCP